MRPSPDPVSVPPVAFVAGVAAVAILGAALQAVASQAWWMALLAIPAAAGVVVAGRTVLWKQAVEVLGQTAPALLPGHIGALEYDLAASAVHELTPTQWNTLGTLCRTATGVPVPALPGEDVTELYNRALLTLALLENTRDGTQLHIAHASANGYAAYALMWRERRGIAPVCN